MKTTKRRLTGSILILASLLATSSAAQNCDGCTPLNDLGSGLYLGTYEGGLYSGGLNVPPAPHVAAANQAVSKIVLRDSFGAPDADGKIGLISISMSNCNQEFSAFERRADLDTHRGAQVRVVNGCQGGQALDTISNPAVPYWSHLTLRVQSAGLSPDQVQAAWIKMADASPQGTDFPAHALGEMANATTVLHLLKSFYPNLALVFFSSRTYGGYTTNPLRGEPLSYETGFAVKWLIEAQIAGEPDLNYDPANGPVVAPVVLWGPYLWANGTTPRSDGLVWLPGDFEGDGVHPAPSGEQKVADMLEDFFQFDRFATRWYGAPTERRLIALDAVADATVNGNQPTVNFGADPKLIAAGTIMHAYVKFDLAGVNGTLEQAKLSFITPESNTTTAVGTELRGVSDDTWQESTITFANAPAIDGASHGDLPLLSRGTATSFDVTSDVHANWGGSVSFALTSTASSAGMKEFLSSEGGGTPRLVLTLRPPCDDPAVPYCRSLVNTSGARATLTSTGSASVSTNDLELVASGMPASVPALFFYGRTAVQQSFGEGLRCVGGGTARLGPPVLVDAGGTASRALDFGTPPLSAGPLSVMPGDRLHLQCWFRDSTGGPAGFNLSDAQQFVICP